MIKKIGKKWKWDKNDQTWKFDRNGRTSKNGQNWKLDGFEKKSKKKNENGLKMTKLKNWTEMDEH